jgi:hypothetical protein
MGNLSYPIKTHIGKGSAPPEDHWNAIKLRPDVQNENWAVRQNEFKKRHVLCFQSIDVIFQAGGQMSCRGISEAHQRLLPEKRPCRR